MEYETGSWSSQGQRGAGRTMSQTNPGWRNAETPALSPPWPLPTWEGFPSHAEEKEREERIFWHNLGWQRGWWRGSHVPCVPQQQPAGGRGN